MVKDDNKQAVDDFRKLDVYQRMYRLMKVIIVKVIPKLPREEKFDLADQIRRASKAAPALLAEGFAKRFQPKHWQKYLADTRGECNEMIVHLSVIKDIYHDYINPESCQTLIDQYEISCRQLTSFSKSLFVHHQTTKQLDH